MSYFKRILIALAVIIGGITSYYGLSADEKIPIENTNLDEPYSVLRANKTQDQTTQTVTGYIVGQPISESAVVTNHYPNNYALALADTSNETNPANMLFVQVPPDSRAEFGLQSNPNLKGSRIMVTGTLTAYFSHTGLTNATSMEKLITSSPIQENDQALPPYYKEAVGKTGEALKSSLHNIIDDHRMLTYSEVWEALRFTDQDPHNRDHIILFYSGKSVEKRANDAEDNNWNREHIWAKSHGNFGTSIGPGTDLHHLRPTDVSVNKSRGNLDFDEGGSPHPEAPGNYFDYDSWEPRNSVKGDVARMLFYMAVRYEGDRGEVDLELNNKVQNGSAPFMGRLSVLLAWNKADPVDDFERERNERIYSRYQHNRNPFIDHPEWAEAIWENE